MKQLAFFAAGLILGICIAAAKAQNWLIVSGAAVHLDGQSHCNNHFTPGVGMERGDVAIGIYQNSNCKTSIYAAQGWLPLRLGSVKLGTLAGAVSGYGRPVTPVAALAASFEWERQKLNLIYVPPVKGSSGNVLWVQAGVRW